MNKSKPGTVKVGAISKAQNSKRTSKCQVFFSKNEKFEQSQCRKRYIRTLKTLDPNFGNVIP